MEAVREMVDQVAAQAKLSRTSARKAIYLLSLAEDGRTLEQAAQALGLTQDTVKAWCKRYDITLADHDPFPKEKFPIRPKPVTVLKLTGAKSALPLFGARQERPKGENGRCPHQVTATVEGRVYCCDCGRDRTPKPVKEKADG